MYHLMSEIVIRVLGILIGRHIEAVEIPSNTPWYTKLLHTIFILTTIAGLLISLYFFWYAILAIGMFGEYQHPWQVWVYDALVLLLPFFNSAILIWEHKLPINPWAITATIGMVIPNTKITRVKFLAFSQTIRRERQQYAALSILCSDR